MKPTKGKTISITLSIFILILALGAIIGGIFMLVLGISNNTEILPIVLFSVFGAILIIIGLGLLTFGIWSLWIGCSLVATKGSIANDNSVATNKLNKVCPECGCTNTNNVDTCQSCGTKLDK